jgi:HK97 gp10 family phage protein
MIRMRLVGLEATERRLNRFSTEAVKGVRAQVKASAQAIRKGARQRVPKESGALAKSIRVRYSRDQLSAEIGVRKWYAHFIEFGTVEHHAVPFLFPAWEGARADYLSGIRHALSEAMP